jgi:hypothetical protein
VNPERCLRLVEAALLPAIMIIGTDIAQDHAVSFPSLRC